MVKCISNEDSLNCHPDGCKDCLYNVADLPEPVWEPDMDTFIDEDGLNELSQIFNI